MAVSFLPSAGARLLALAHRPRGEVARSAEGGRMDWIAALIGGLGIGSVLTRVVEHFFSRRTLLQERDYQEMREAYLGLLGALHQTAVR
jgi:hypothetical protein